MILEGKLHRSRTRLKRRLGRPFLRAVLITAMVAAGGSPLITATAAHAATPPTGGNRLHVQVAASQPWTDTGIDVAVGTRVSIEAYGTIKIAGSDPGKSPSAQTKGQPNSDATQCTATDDATRSWVAPGLYCWTMVGKIGTGGIPFEVDNGLIVNPPQSGRLYLGVNDGTGEFGDNSGSWTAEVWATWNNCPPIFFFGVRGSGETAASNGGYGVPVAAHRYFLQSSYYASDIEPAPIDYQAIPVSGLTDAFITAPIAYNDSVGEGVTALALRMIQGLGSSSCPQAKVALAGYSQGANVVDNYLDFATASPAHKPFLTNIKDVALYGDPRHSSQVLSYERWFDVSPNPGGFDPSKYQGSGVALKVQPPFVTNPVGDALRSWCDLTFDKPDGTPTLDPICGMPTDITNQPAIKIYAGLNVQGRHDKYASDLSNNQSVVSVAVQDSFTHLR